MKFTKVMIFLLGIFFIGFPEIALAQNNYLLGKHFADLQEQIDTIQLTPGPAGPQGPMEPAAQNAPLPPNGTQVGPGLYHVHTRVLWDLGWLTDYTYLSDDDFFTYWEKPTPLQIYQKGFYWGGLHCGQDPSLSTGPDQPEGVIYRIEAHFYDQY